MIPPLRCGAAAAIGLLFGTAHAQMSRGANGMLIRPPPSAASVAQPQYPSVPVVSASTPALNGSYSLSAQAIANISAIVSGIAAGQGFPQGAATMVYLDAAGTPHTFPSTAEFVAFGAAIRDYVYATQLNAGGQVMAMPILPLSIP